MTGKTLNGEFSNEKPDSPLDKFLKRMRWQERKGIEVARNNARGDALFTYLYFERQRICKEITINEGEFILDYNPPCIAMDILPARRSDTEPIRAEEEGEERYHLLTDKIAVMLNPIIEPSRDRFLPDRIRGIAVGLYQMDIGDGNVLAGRDYARFCGEARLGTPSPEGCGTLHYFVLYNKDYDSQLLKILDDFGLDAQFAQQGVPEESLQFCTNNHITGCGVGKYFLKRED